MKFLNGLFFGVLAFITACTPNSSGDIDKSHDLQLTKLKEQVIPKFQQLEFEDSITGKTMAYNLFTPENYDPIKSYPLVVFIADASSVGKGVLTPLTQGYGGITWATESSQSKNPSFVLVPAFTGPEPAVNDNWHTSEEVDIAYRLINSVISEFNINKEKIYATGQSMGGMISFYWNVTYPDLFAASLFVGSQWDVSVLEPLKNKSFFYVVSAGDQKASKGMEQLGNLLRKKGVEYGTTQFSAELSNIEKESYIQNLLSEKHSINFVQFEAGTVSSNTAQWGGAEHMYSFDHAYKLKSIRDWLFEQTKNSED
ncbi:alpha/beta hydrolase-fold protein [Pseudoalteromonas sp. UCD-33C]|uniref:carboxylesterase family protein n=1 Tax=Pseudoalteromonas sp. UCD-33C TaxID=1716175 RepID=UPI0006CA328D|nr:alpha/beta hydrolase-fold protein [Pseudoalteromonas sp. UCD-33C]KPM76081.1 pyrroline-5-carboxylate reductase [Pseudoalteromonas sp. UCD-33C]